MQKRKLFLLSLPVFLAFAVSSCNTGARPSEGSREPSNQNTSEVQNSSSFETLTSSKNDDSSVPQSSSYYSDVSSSNSSSSSKEASSYIPDESDESIYIINEGTLDKGEFDADKDEYTFALSGQYKQIYVNAPEKNIIVELSGVTVENNENSPIFVQDCENFELSAKKNTTNTINDTRPTYVEDIDGQGKGAIYIDNGDLKLKGAGTLNINANYYNGIHCKDDVKIQKQTLNITAVNHAIRGNDSITVTSGTINVSCGGDGLHSDNSDISDKGNQRGNVTINGGNLTINSWSDAIHAAYNAIINQEDSSVSTSVVAKTNKYSTYDGEIIETSTTNFYLKLNQTTYSNGNYTYAAYINNIWYPAIYKGTQSGQGPMGPGGGANYFYKIEKPNDATSFTLYRFQGSNVTSFSTTSYNAVSDAKAFNTVYDTVQISVNNQKISFGSWSNYSSGNSNKSDVSAKGIKAENEIYIYAGTIDIKAYDDAIHANNDGTIENGETPLGNVIINGGNLTLFASDDAVHADGELSISGGEIHITSSYEGLEGNVINISGGSSYVYATDDGVNASAGNNSPLINITGGFLDVEVSTNGDTDGIDSNGAYTQDGGIVIIKGPGSASGSGGGAAALDTDGSVTIRSGTLIVFGSIEKTPSSSVTKTLVSSSSVSAGSHTISFASSGTSYSTTLKSSSKGCVVYSSLGSATLN